MATDEATQSGLPSCDWTPRGTRAVVVPAAASRTHPLPRGVQTDLGKSLLVLESPVLVESLSFIWRWRRLPAPSHQERHWGGGPGWNIWGILRGAQLKDTEEFPPSQKMLGGGLAETRQENCPPTGKVLGRGARLGKKSRNTQGSAERCWGRSVVGDWMVLAEWLSKRLIWH